MFNLLGHKRETEIRMIDPRMERKPKSIFIKSEIEMDDVVKEYSGKYNIYVGINERKPNGTTKTDIISINNIVIDVDAVRSRGFEKDACTNEELEKCYTIASQISYDMLQRGFKKPKIAMTGNGYQLWFAIPKIRILKSNSTLIENKIKMFHKEIIEKYSNGIDCSIDNIGDLPRIVKLIGSMSIKGNNTSDRPYRMSKWIDKDITRDEDSEFRDYILMLEPKSEPSNNIIAPTILPEEWIDNDKIDVLYKQDEKFKNLMEGNWEEYGYKTRSEAEMGMLCKFLFYKFPKKQVFFLMNQCKIGKWTEAKEHYREYQWKNAFEFAKLNNFFGSVNTNAEFFEKAIKTFGDFNDMADRFMKVQPIYYDNHKMWWYWNFKNNSWEMVDETDIMIKIDNSVNVQKTSTSSVKSEIIESLKKTGRKNKPHDLPETWVQFKNTIVDIETGEEMKVTPAYFAVNPIPWELGDSDDTPELDKLFKEWVGEEEVESVYEMIAFLLAPTYFIHRLFCLIGSGSNGKSKCFELIRKFLGDKNCASTELDRLLHQRFEPCKLYKKLMAQMGETNFTVLKKTSMLKQLTGQDLIGFEFKNKNPFDDMNYAKILIATNSLPVTMDKTIGFYRRWRIIDFPNQFSGDEDPLNRITDIEYGRLARKSVNILMKLWKTRQFTTGGTVDEQMVKYEAKSNPFVLFIKENCIKDSNYKMKFDEFLEDYKKFLQENGYRNQESNEITRILKNEGYEKKRTTENVGKNKVNIVYIYGFRFKNMDEVKKEYQKTL